MEFPGLRIEALPKGNPQKLQMEALVNFPPCLIGMEACGGAHNWAREMIKLGHDVRIMAPQFVAPYRKSGKVVTISWR